MIESGVFWATGVETQEDVYARLDAFHAFENTNDGWWGIEFRPRAKVAELQVYVKPDKRGGFVGLRLAKRGVARAWELGADKVSMVILEGNPFYKNPTRAMRIIGAHHEATLRRHYWFSGKSRDVMFFAIFKEDVCRN